MDKFTPEQVNISNTFDEKDKTLYNKYRVGGLGVDQALNAVVEVKTGKPQPKAPLLQRVAEGTLDIVGGKELAQGAGQVLASPFVNKLSEETRVQQEGVAKQLIERIKLAREEGDVAKINKWTELLGGLDYGADISKGFTDDLVTDKEVIGSSLKLAGTAGGGFVGGNLMRGGTIASAGGKLTKAVNLIPEGAIGNTIKGIVAEGAIQGGSFGLGDSVSKGDNFQDTAINTIKNTAFGAGTGLALGKTFQYGGRLLTGKAGVVAEKVVSKKASKLSDYIKIETTQERLLKSVDTGRTVENTSDVLSSIAGKENLLTIPEKTRLLNIEPELGEKYFNVLKQGQISDTAPSLLETATQDTLDAMEKYKIATNKVGGEISSIKDKLKVLPAPVEKVTDIKNSIITSLESKGLKWDGKKFVIKSSSNTPFTATDVNNINSEIVISLNNIEKSGSMEQLLLAMESLDNKINYSKVADISGSLQGISKKVRGSLKDIRNGALNPNEAKVFQEFSDAQNFMDEFFKSNNKAQVLIKRVSSENMADTKRLANEIKRVTGVDILDYANLYKILASTTSNTSRERSLLTNMMGGVANSVLSASPVGVAKGVVGGIIETVGNKVTNINKLDEIMKAIRSIPVKN